MQVIGVFKRLDLKPYNSAIVYKAYLHGILVYIGASRNGLVRIAHNHHVLKHFLSNSNCRVEYICFSNSKEAFKVESQLIKELKPIINIINISNTRAKMNESSRQHIARMSYRLKIRKSA